MGVLLLSGSNAFRLAVQFIMFPVLARLLDPADYGLMGLAMPVVLFALTLGEGGMGPALLRAADPDGRVESTMFWTSLGIGLICGATLLGLAPLLGLALGDARITPVLLWLAPIMLLSALSSVPSVRIQRRGANWIFATGDVASSLTGAAAAFACAYNGWGVWSLVVQQLVIWTVKVSVIFPLSGNKVGGRLCPASLRYLLRHGTPLVGSNLLNLFSMSVDALLVGRILGVKELGYYVLAFQIVRIPEAILNGPVFLTFLPAIARLDTKSPAATTLLLQALRMMLAISAPLMLGLAATAGLALPLLLGTRWQPAVMLLMLLAPPAIAQTLGWLARALLIGRGRSSLQFRLSLLNAGLTLAGVLGGVAFGIDGVAAGIGISVILGNLAYLIAAMAELRLGVAQLGRAVGAPLIAAGFMVLGVAALRLLLAHAGCPAVAALLLSIGAGALLYGGAIWRLAPDLLGAGATLFWRRPAVPAE